MSQILTDKRCGRCQEVKPIEQFYRHRSKSDGRRGECKTCTTAYDNALYHKDPEKSKAKNHAKYEKRRDFRKENRRRSSSLLSYDQYQVMALAQGYVCAICGKAETVKHTRTGTIKNLSVDHCHKTGKVRGLLCFSCNAALGKFNDDPELLAKALAYLVG